MSGGDTGAVLGEDGLARCPWAAHDPVNRDYHDSEWGRGIHGESAWLERLTLEAFQSGLTWLTILNKRPAFREAFDGFEADRIAAYTDADVQRLMADARIVRNRRKVEATINNARATVALRTEGGLEALIRDHAPRQGAPVPLRVEDVPATSPASHSLAAALKKRGFAHVGPTTMYALMQATGIVNDHLADCHARGHAVPSGA